ncbi:MAG: ribonuclease III [Bdellovibrionia bacterium]
MSDVEKKIGYRFKNRDLLQRALTHKSYAHENKIVDNNEKLEFLGDAVLDLVIGEMLFELFPKDTEGGLSKKRASIVNEEVLSEIAQKLDLSGFMRLGKGESSSGGAAKPRLLASAFEAIVGSIYLDGGFEVAKVFLRREFSPAMTLLRDQNLDFERDYKTRLQELVQRKQKQTPTYELLQEQGPPHDREFTVCVKVGSEEWAQGIGKSKKSAEQEAAKAAIAAHFRGE